MEPGAFATGPTRTPETPDEVSAPTLCRNALTCGCDQNDAHTAGAFEACSGAGFEGDGLGTGTDGADACGETPVCVDAVVETLLDIAQPDSATASAAETARTTTREHPNIADP